MCRIGDVNTWYTNWESFHSTYAVPEASNSFPTGIIVVKLEGGVSQWALEQSLCG